MRDGQAIMTRGDIYFADLTPVVGSEQGGVRPVLVIQNNRGNRHSPTVIVAVMTKVEGKTGVKKNMPTHVIVSHDITGLAHDSIIECEQLRTIDKTRLDNRVGWATPGTMHEVDQAIDIAVGRAPGYD